MLWLWGHCHGASFARADDTCKLGAGTAPFPTVKARAQLRSDDQP